MLVLARFASLAALAGWAMAQEKALTSENIASMGNNTLFSQWRPKAHFMAPAGWMNDPCGAMYDNKTDTYHLFYQWHPNHINWGNISWGHATSKDMITWEDVGGWQDSQAVALGPTGFGKYDGLGVFSGTGHAVNLNGTADGTLTVFYTSVSQLPTSWSAPYINGTESQSIAQSNDSGKTWTRLETNPVLKSPPAGWNVTGWRDPFVLPWPEMDKLLGNKDPHWYAVFGSGIKEVGPRIPFYSAPQSNLANWTYHGPLWEPAKNTSLGEVDETGSYGFNFEVSGFFSLKDSSGRDHFYVNMGTEGGNTTTHQNAHWALWNEGNVTRNNDGSPHFEPISGGAADWGLLYAITSFHDPKKNRRVQWGWLPEDLDANLTSAAQQGFQGSLGLPRVLFVKETAHVVDAAAQLGVKTKGNSWYESEGDANETIGKYTAYTLGVRPAADVVNALRASAKHSKGRTGVYKKSAMLDAAGSKHMSVHARFTDVTGRVGLTVAASPDGDEQTLVHYDASTNTVTVDRSHSSLITQFNNATQVGHFKPYTIAGPAPERKDKNSNSGGGGSDHQNQNGDLQTRPGSKPHQQQGGDKKNKKKQKQNKAKFHTEPIDLTLFLDGSALEIFINDRFALSTRIYPSRNSSTGVGVYVDGKNSSCQVEELHLWTGLKNVWPKRPENSGSKLVWDDAKATGNYTWWSGN